MNGPIRRLALGLFAGFAVLLLLLTWFQVLRADPLKNDPRNPRPVLTERSKERGLIVTIDGTVVARSIPEADGRSFMRIYPEGGAFVHPVGYASFLVGDTGLEAAYAAQLRSRRDLTISDIVAAILGRDLRPKSIEITIDARLQRAALDALGDQRGAVVALDPSTGAIRALVSTPIFDPNPLLGSKAAESWDALLNDAGQPLFDRATRQLYAPGSTFKTVVMAAALDTGVAGPETEFPNLREFPLPNSTATISNFGGGLCGPGDSVDLLTAFVRSCNTVFADLAIRLGAEEIALTAEALGFNQELTFPWRVPDAVWPTGALVEDQAALAQSGIGERDVRATPLHMAMVAAAVANNGVATNPYLVQRLFDADGQTIESTAPTDMGRAMASGTAAVLADMMERVVTEGTGRLAAVPGVRVAGKTGTATGRGSFSNVWFIGFAPVDNPTIALAVFVEGSPISGESATGGSVAAPIAAEIISAWLETSP